MKLVHFSTVGPPVHPKLGQALMAMAHELQRSENEDPTFSLSSNVEIVDHNRNLKSGSQSAWDFFFLSLILTDVAFFDRNFLAFLKVTGNDQRQDHQYHQLQTLRIWWKICSEQRWPIAQVSGNRVVDAGHVNLKDKIDGLVMPVGWWCQKTA